MNLFVKLIEPEKQGEKYDGTSFEFIITNYGRKVVVILDDKY